MFTFDFGKIKFVFKNNKRLNSSDFIDCFEESKMLNNMEKSFLLKQKKGKN